MYRKEVSENNPLRILDRSIHGGLGVGNLGVIMARAGVGKTAFLVQIGLDDAMRTRPVLHVALGQSLEHVRSWYDALFDDLALVYNLEDKETVRNSIAQNRFLQTYGDGCLPPERLESGLALYERTTGFQPKAILIDGYDWEQATVVKMAADLGALKNLAKRAGAELWMTAQTHRSLTKSHPTALTPPCDEYQELVDIAVFLDPVEDHVTVRLLKDHDSPSPADTRLQLDCDSMRLRSADEPARVGKLPPRAFMLLSGGAKGAEAAFGEAAERCGVRETTFSFPGRDVARTRGLAELDDEELHRGEVSLAYVEANLHRTFPKTQTFRKVLQTIWHQVNTSGEVFVVGCIQDDNTVSGGTGWAAELARHLRKPLFVFDQDKEAWFHWHADQWTKMDPPKIRRTRFTGTGTRFLSDAGKAAIDKLFTDTFE